MKKNKSHKIYSAKGRASLLAVLMTLPALPVFAQEEEPTPATPVRKVMIWGNVYGGARKAVVEGTATVNLHGGNVTEEDEATTSDNIVIGGVYGGNDISNTVVGGATVTADGRDLFVAYLYGGGNGDYDYTSETLADGETANPYYGLSRPDITTTSVTINGGTYGYVYGGGNSATVTESTVITANDEMEHIDIGKFATESELSSMGIVTRYFNFTDFKVSRMFGGNNKVAMDIRPTWNLQKGSVNWLYSGGNLGDMTHENGLLLNIPKESEIVVENMFGGCRMANVKPGGDSWNFATYKANGDYTYSEDGTDFTFPAGMSARVLVQGGQVTNIYGGNDVSGKVYGGNAVEIFHNVKGNVFGGGNGSYPYTDNIEVKKYCPPYADIYYGIPDGKTSIEALNDFRPNAEQVYIKLGGTEADNTVIGGSVFLGGNSATIKHSEEIADPMAKLELGSYVTVDQIFLGNNGLDMIRYNEAGADGSADTEESPNGTYGASSAAVAGGAFGNLGKYEGALRTLQREDWDGSDKAEEGKKRFSSLVLTTPETFAEYMNGAAMDIRPTVAFTEGYEDYSTNIGSFYCGGNVGSMIFEGMVTLNFSEKVNIYSKVVGGCNSAYVPETTYNAAYDGGIIGTSAEQTDYTSDGKIKDRLTMNFGGMLLTPKKLNEEKTALEWNVEGTGDDARFEGGNVYGGCYASGHINGNVVINLNETTVDKTIFDDAGVSLEEQRDDVIASALSVLGGGYGEDSEIWGNVTINLNKGYTFQIFGGGEMGAVGKKTEGAYEYNEAYGTVVNLSGKVAGSEVGEEGSNANLAEAEYIYGGGYAGLVAGNTVVNLGNGRLYGAFGGACDADIKGHSETYIGRQPSSSGSGFDDGFPWLKDHVYGGNDLGGTIFGSKDFSDNVSADLPITPYRPTVTTAGAYVEYVQGHMMNIFGGNYGGYDYHVKDADDDTDEDGEFADYHDNQPRLGHAFVNFKPNSNSENTTQRLYGGSEGMGLNNLHEKDQMQNSSYTLVDIKDEVGDRFKNLEVFGAGENAGLGMGVTKATADANEDGVTAAAVIDLARGEIAAAYGGSFQEGITRRTLVNVPGPEDGKTGSTIKVGNLFAGSYGGDYNSESGLKPCDVYEGTVNYGSETAVVTGSLFGGNNNNRRTLFGRVNVNSAVWTDREHTKLGKVFGAGKGGYTWSEYTEVNLNAGARVYEVYGGGEMGCVVNKGTVAKLVNMFGASSSLDSLTSKVYDNYGGLANDLAQERYNGKKFNTNVIINQGAVVDGYVYGGGLGDVEGHNGDDSDTELGDANSGNVFGTTYVALLGGEVKKDIYGAGSVGSIVNSHGVEEDDLGNPFIASSNVYIGGGTVRNVYGGGWEGAVGIHLGTTSSPIDTDVPGETNVWIGKADGDTFTYLDGIPAIQRNVYGGGEGGAVCGTTHMTIKRGYIGYVYEDGEYKENIEDKSYMVNNVFQPNDRLKDAGNVFGGGYVNFGITDHTDVEMYDGVVRGSVFGGGEIAAVGRGMASAGTDGAYPAVPGTSAAYVQNHGMKIYNAGSTLVKIYGGEIHRNVFGGGRGFNNLGEIGTLNTDGYVFGNTEVRIRGGEIGTQEGLAEGYGNVFGGGDVGFVYSGTGWKRGESFSDEDLVSGVPSDGGGYYYKDGTIANGLTEDCKVVIEPYAKVEGSSVSINGNDYTAGDYVTLEDLSTLTRKNAADKAKWDQLAKTGVTIHNAVFAGGNVSVGSDMLSANTVTVYGNATAAVRDIYDFDLISVGAEHIGGIYGDGNMTLVDGCRELNISNYGTDFYNLSNSIDQTTYNTLTPRERAYYKLKYKCAQACTDINGDNHEVGETLMSDDILNLFEKGGAVVNADGTPNPAYWTPDGVSTIYEGRVLNTIQRADFVGIFGSRIVMQGAQDRVPSKADYTNYAVNRVGEVSLNQESAHGNYFGLYSVVNFLGNLTSDVKFTDTRTAADGSAYPADGKTFYAFKEANKNSSNRNNGISQNKVSMATGVFLEITREPAVETDEETTKDWGYITGVVELGLVDGATTGAGGGYVYAKNVHGAMTDHSGSWSKMTLSEFNERALTYRQFTYAAATASDDIETSGNFIHKDKTIVDDCFPMANSYVGSDASPAHYWYIKDKVYVYDEYISAYTGMAGSYLDKLNLPMPISKESHGTLTLVNVKPNRYATRTATVGNVTYQPGDPIDYWTWSQISDATQQGKFAETVYAIVEDCTIDGTKYDKGAVLTEAQKSALGTNPTVVVAGKPDATVNDVLRDANNLSHAGGFLLTGGFNNPEAWQITAPAPSFKATTGGVFGQKDYSVGNIISQNDVDNYPSEAASLAGQAQKELAYVITAETTVTNKDGAEQHLFPGTAVVASDYAAGTWSSMPVEAAKVVTGTLKLDDTRTLYPGELLSASEVTTLKATYSSLSSQIDEVVLAAYYITEAGKYGGKNYTANGNYNALDSWCAVSESERANFTYDYDALDLLVDPTYSGSMALYDGTLNPKVYSVPQPIDYTAEYTGTESLTFTNSSGESQTLTSGIKIQRKDFEYVPNEQRHYTQIDIEAAGTYYYVKTPFTRGDVRYVAGMAMSAGDYSDLSESQKANVMTLTVDGAQTGTYYFCRDDYAVGEHGDGVSVTDAFTSTAYTANVPAGTIINETTYGTLVNKQENFEIYGTTPEQTSTLYVPHGADLYDLTKEKIITVVYQYDYEEKEGTKTTAQSERHVINIHINFKSGIPEIGELNAPKIVLPGTVIGMRTPSVTPGAYEVTSAGWEIFPNETDAGNHVNGQPYHNNADKLYWYQDNYWVAYYAQTYLGKTYSNAVPFSVANYHDLKAVMDDKDHHYYIDHEDAFKERNPKIYINDYSGSEENGLDILKSLYDLSVGNTIDGHAALYERVKGCANLEIILRTNIDHSDASWTPVGDASQCFEGTLHGDGYTISGLNNSLFDHLCGSVYNLGVMGSFTSAGVANTGAGYVENCWVKTTGTPAGTKAVFGNPTGTGYQVVNCYYPASNAYSATVHARGNATKMPDEAFYNGTVAYDLNGFYLYKRYNDGKNQATGLEYKYWKSGSDEPQTGHYADNAQYCSTGYGDIKYVEERFADGDFIYADGTIPSETDSRWSETDETYYPIWPDDYLFFGQMLTYGHDDLREHQDVPSHINRSAGRVLTSAEGNRVYRAPAYFRNSIMSMAHFNPYALFAQSKKGDAAVMAYKDMTAIDFTGGKGDVAGGYKLAFNDGKFYQPLLDDDGLTGFNNVDLTRNLLVYTGTESPASAQTNTVVSGYLNEPTYAETDDTYRSVATAAIAGIKGHQVVKSGAAYVTEKDHLLVDKQDFNAPIAYKMGNGQRMWYQRIPDNYVNSKDGWEGISLPFAAELVTTNDKGEITHFYSGSAESKNDTGTKIGHEYWLRGFVGISNDPSDESVKIADMTYPNAGSDPAKTVANTFLWDYYYSANTQKDANADTYQTYYSTSRTYSNYARLANGKPYIIGFPGERYYEFDLSGRFVAQNTAATAPAVLGKQTITFASEPGYSVGVSDSENTGVTNGGYTFWPSYLKQRFDAGAAYVLNAEGSAYENVAGTTDAFRPYFKGPGAGARRMVRSIAFSDELSEPQGAEKDLSDDVASGITIEARSHKIIVTSALRSEVDVLIVTSGGLRLNSFTIRPGETVETPVSISGVYIVQVAGGRYTKKMAVK